VELNKTGFATFGVFYELPRIYQVSADSKNNEKRKTTDIDFATATLISMELTRST